MDTQFWKTVWEEGRINFHQPDFHPKLMEYAPTFGDFAGKTALVPLCGKTKDMVWLADRGLTVVGVEFVESAVRAFFEETVSEVPHGVSENGFAVYRGGDFQLFSGDFFEFNSNCPIDFVYDRAAMVALPPEMRLRYVDTIKRNLAPGGQILLLTFEYNPLVMDGPPFTVEQDEIERLYGPDFSIEVLERGPITGENPRLMAVPGMRQAVYRVSPKGAGY